MDCGALQNHPPCDTIRVENGYLVCPYCGKNRRVLRILPETRAEHLQLYCRTCRREFIVNIEKGECLKGHGQ